MTGIVASLIQDIDEEFGVGFARKNPNLIGALAIHHALTGLTNSFFAEGLRNEYNVIDNIAQAIYATKSAIADLSHSVSAVGAAIGDLDSVGVAAAADTIKEGADNIGKAITGFINGANK